jgi:predicted GNAT family N-acyltransferase
MGLIESEARSQGCHRSVLHAQKQVIEFYRGLGYEVTSGEFEEAGITHVEMEKSL